MKKLVAVLALITFNVHAAPDCRELPSCESLGFICSSEECGDLKALSCPFDLSKKVCFPKEKECEVGDILYNNLKCYNFGCGKSPIAVVSDTENRIALSIDTRPKLIFGNYGVDIPDLENCTSGLAKTTCDTNGKQNTKIILEYGAANNLEYPAAEYCNNLTFGNLPAGSWWLPSGKELWTATKLNADSAIAAYAKLGLTFPFTEFISSTENSIANNFHYQNTGNGDMWARPKNIQDQVFCAIGY